MAEQQAANNQAGNEAAQHEFGIQRIYVKDISLEAPNTPSIFLKQWQPEVNMDINTQSSVIEDDTHEVVLRLTITVKLAEETAFLIEVHQAGIFFVKGFPEDQLRHMLGSFCPNTLYPYAREAVTNLAIRGGFPQLYLTPVNFDALYEEHLKEAAGGSDEKTH